MINGLVILNLVIQKNPSEVKIVRVLDSRFRENDVRAAIFRHTREGGYPVYKPTFYGFIKIQLSSSKDRNFFLTLS
jgi:hypothetical protein